MNTKTLWQRCQAFGKRHPHCVQLVLALGIIGLCTLMALGFWRIGLRVENILMLYMLCVVLVVVVTRGYVLGIVSSVLCLFIFSYLFTAPRYTFWISDSRYLVSLSIFLIISVITSALMTQLQKQARIARHNEMLAQNLYKLTGEYQNVSGTAQVLQHGLHSLHAVQRHTCLVYLATGPGQLSAPQVESGRPIRAYPENTADAVWALTHDAPCGVGTPHAVQSPFKFLPMRGTDRVWGVLAVDCHDGDLNEDESICVHTILTQMGLAIQRENLYLEREESRIALEKETLRNNLLRSLSHDLRTPLTGIAGSTSFILDSYDALDDDTVRALLRDILSDATWLNNLVVNLLNMTRIQQGQLVIEKKGEVVDEIVAEACSRMQHALRGRHLQTALPTDVLLVPMDGQLIIQVLVNLLDNAAKHTKEGCTIRLSVYQRGQRAVFEVADDGGGIAPELMDRLFESFVTGQSNRYDAHRGVGLGLSICASIVRAHGGEITAENNQAGGATFRFTLPLSSPAPRPAATL